MRCCLLSEKWPQEVVVELEFNLFTRVFTTSRAEAMTREKCSTASEKCFPIEVDQCHLSAFRVSQVQLLMCPWIVCE